MTPTERKQQLRKELKAQRAAIPAAVRHHADAAIVARLAERLAGLRPGYRQVFSFVSYAAEPCLDGLAAVLPETVRRGLPVIAGEGRGEMMFRLAPSDRKDLVPGRFGILEPPDDERRAPRLIADEATIVLVPAIAIDHQGVRLGYGGGYYDRFLAAHPEVTTVGVVFAALWLEELPREPFDRPVDWVVTEAGIYRTQGPKGED